MILPPLVFPGWGRIPSVTYKWAQSARAFVPSWPFQLSLKVCG
jgi:hypothetical protein